MKKTDGVVDAFSVSGGVTPRESFDAVMYVVRVYSIGGGDVTGANISVSELKWVSTR